MKFLLISQVFYPDQVSTASLFTMLCTRLADAQVDVEVWAAQPSYTESARQVNELDHMGVRIKYLASTNFRKDSILGRGLNIFTFTLSAGLKLIFSREKFPVWTHTTPPFLGIVIASILKLKRRKLIYILLDIFPEGLFRLKMLSRYNPLAILWNSLFKLTIESCELVIAIGRDMKQYIDELSPGLSDKLIYLPHWHDGEIIFPYNIENNSFIRAYNLEKKFIVQYSGNMGLWNDMTTIGKAVSASPDDVVFIFNGGGRRKNELLEAIGERAGEKVLFLPFQPPEMFNDLINAAHVHLVTLRKGLDGMAVPCKIYGIMAAGKPVIGLVPGNSEIGLTISEENCGIIVDPEDSEGLLRELLNLRNNPELRKLYGNNSRIGFELKYDIGVISNKYKDLIRFYSQ